MKRLSSFLAIFILASLFVTRPPGVWAQCLPGVSISNPSPAVNDWFGYAVGVSGNVAVVGAYQDDTLGVDAGTAYVYNASTGAPIMTLNNPAPADGDLFGRSVAISDGVAVVGAAGDDAGVGDAGTAYVFNAMTGTLITTLFNPNPTATDNFGISVAISGNMAVVGAFQDDAGAGDAGQAYVFNATTGALIATLINPNPTAADYFGFSVGISGNVAVVGAYLDDAGENGAGQAYVFNATTGALKTTLINPLPSVFAQFGFSVAVSGNMVAVGASLANIGAAHTGRGYVFDATTGGLISTLDLPVARAEGRLGASVAIDGNVVAAGAYETTPFTMDSGKVYVFHATTGALTATLDNPSPFAADSFGVSVGLSDGVAVVGAYFDDTGAGNAGSVYTFTCNIPPTPTPTPEPTPVEGRELGDFDDSGCTNVSDFLFLLDNWQIVPPIGPPAIGVEDFLNLLDNWQAGPQCAA